MHTFTSALVATALFSCLGLSAPVGNPTLKPRDICLTRADAEYLVENYALLLNSTFSYVRAADILAEDFTDYSDSINFLAGVPLSTPIFTTLAAFEESQSAQAPVPLQVLSIDAIGCTNIGWRWLAYPGSGIKEVKGINIFYAVQGTGSSNGWQIGTVFAEFNSAAWTIDVGGTATPPSQ